MPRLLAKRRGLLPQRWPTIITELALGQIICVETVICQGRNKNGVLTIMNHLSVLAVEQLLQRVFFFNDQVARRCGVVEKSTSCYGLQLTH